MSQESSCPVVTRRSQFLRQEAACQEGLGDDLCHAFQLDYICVIFSKKYGTVEGQHIETSCGLGDDFQLDI